MPLAPYIYLKGYALCRRPLLNLFAVNFPIDVSRFLKVFRFLEISTNPSIRCRISRLYYSSSYYLFFVFLICSMFLFLLFQNSVRFGFARSPFGAIWGPWCILFDILGPFWHLGSTLGSHFGTSGAPWEAILVPRDHFGGPWEQQPGHDVANDRIFADFGVISGLIYVGFSGPKSLTTRFICKLVSVSYFQRLLI